MRNSLVLTDKEGEVNVPRVDGDGSHVVVNPVVKYDDDLGINAPYVLCQPGTPDYSWLAIRHISTKQVVGQGIVAPRRDTVFIRWNYHCPFALFPYPYIYVRTCHGAAISAIDKFYPDALSVSAWTQ